MKNKYIHIIILNSLLLLSIFINNKYKQVVGDFKDTFNNNITSGVVSPYISLVNDSSVMFSIQTENENTSRNSMGNIKQALFSSECQITGCSSQLCIDKDSPVFATSCNFNSEYTCYQSAICETQANTGVCGWTQTTDLTTCLANPIPTPVYSPIRVLYVEKTGNDNDNNGSEEAPFLTINKALELAQAGDEVRIGSGTYSENLDIYDLQGTKETPIYIVGGSETKDNYPIIDGGDIGFNDLANDPTFYLNNCEWLSFERLKFIGGSESTFQLDDSVYISFRRNEFSINAYGIKLKDNSNHILVEYNEFYQTFGDQTWSDLKYSKWEGGAFVSYGGAGMNEIRYNSFHDLMNGVVLYTSSRIGNHYDANVWVHHNRFEDIVDDPFEPESYSFNNHFYNNTLINTHRMASFAIETNRNMLGPVYIYGNYQLISEDPTGESVSQGRVNSALKIRLNDDYYSNGIYMFNNSIDIAGPDTNTYGIDFLDSTVNKTTILNNIFNVNHTVYSSSNLSLNNSDFDYNFSEQLFNYPEVNGYFGDVPSFLDKVNEDGRLATHSIARDKSIQIADWVGFSSSDIIDLGSDLGAYEHGINDYRSFPDPIYLIPPGGEPINFAPNYSWSPDYLVGYAPNYKPGWME